VFLYLVLAKRRQRCVSFIGRTTIFIIHVVATNMQLAIKILKLQTRWATDMVRGFWR
jgi:hypothetical protein